MESFESVADKVVVYKIREAWLNIAKLYNEMASEYDASISMAFILLTIDQEEGTPVTKIAPRMGMEPNSLSRSLKSLEDQGMIIRIKDEVDKRKVYIKLTDQGSKMRVLALKAVFHLEKTIIKDIPKEKLETFFEVINHVPEAIKEFRNKLAFKEVR
ncbi:MAG: MarR family transcriptional regulator [Bacteroidetes bacterium]|nr:MarR family transcriptional regulator [Bacteroidota bacterium]